MAIIFYPTYEDIINKHSEVIRKSGGSEGVFNESLIRSAIEFIQNDTYYPDFEDKLTHLVFSIAKNHGFCDGNKRTAIVAGAFFLELNAFDQYIIDVFMRNMESIVLLIAQNLLTKEHLRQMLCDLIDKGQLSEETKMIYVELLGKLNDES